MRVGIIGGTGWLGGALGRALVDKGLAEVAVLNRSGPQDYGGRRVRWAQDLADLVALSDVIVVSVRPGDWPGLGLRAEGRLVLSFMAGVGLDTLARSGGRIVRAMPNAAAEIGASYSPWVAGPEVTAMDRAAVALVLGAIGTGEELPEEGQIELMTALSGSGPARLPGRARRRPRRGGAGGGGDGLRLGPAAGGADRRRPSLGENLHRLSRHHLRRA